MKILIIVSLSIISLQSWAQEPSKSEKYSGEFSLGLRSTSSFFDNTPGSIPGIGTGGDFRIRLSNRVNTDWFADYIMSTSESIRRNDYHIGWSVLFYPFNYQNKGFRPYLLAGHCFDYTDQKDIHQYENKAARWSSAIQGGVGTHYYFNEQLDFIVQAQYMLHLGTHLETHLHEEEVEFKTHKGALSEGHLLFTVGINYTIGKLWGRK